MITNRKTLFGLLLISALVSVILATVSSADLIGLRRTPAVVLKVSATRTATRTATPSGPTNTPSNTNTPAPTSTPSDTPAITPTITDTPGATFTPYPSAPLCATPHDNTTFHTLWNSAPGCHYDHEHGTSPFTAQVDDAFPDFDLIALLGGNQVGHTNPSSDMENTHKHGGNKWQVAIPNPSACEAFEDSAYCVDAIAIQYHAFGDYAIEFEARVHSALALLKMCDIAAPTDCGYLYTVQHVDYGQRTIPYQGTVMAYPDTPSPAYLSNLAPYFTADCVGAVQQCRSSLAFVISHNANAASIWTSKSAFRIAPSGSNLLAVLLRVRDNYQLFDWTDQTYPFTFLWLCSSDSGATYNPSACKYNNTTTTVHEVTGVIPAAWDGLAGFDTDTRAGRITGESYTTRFGELATSCIEPGVDCHPLKLVEAFVGQYGSELTAEKASFAIPAHMPERDIYFCAGLPCTEGDAGAVPSGWVGPEN